MNEGAPDAPRVMFVSNGHGEDVVASRLGSALLTKLPALRVDALPLVGLGDAYASAGIPVVGPRKVLPSGGLLMHSLPLFMGDLRAGFLGLTANQLRFLAGVRADLLVTVGDVYSQLVGSLVRARGRFVVQTLVSAYHGDGSSPPPNRRFMERFTTLERMLMRLRAQSVYVRDALTEERLREMGVPHAKYLGNPIADGLSGKVPAALDGETRIVALLPGSRAYASESLPVMLHAIELLAGRASDLPGGRPPVGALAWAGGELPAPEGWSAHPPPVSEPGLEAELRRGQARVLVYRGRFADVLSAARLAIGTSGTAHEQAVAVGRPVVAFPVPPFYSEMFLHNQQRLLGPGLAVVAGNGEAVAEKAAEWLRDPARAEQAGRQGGARVGAPGGSRAIAADIISEAEKLGIMGRTVAARDSSVARWQRR